MIIEKVTWDNSEHGGMRTDDARFGHIGRKYEDHDARLALLSRIDGATLTEFAPSSQRR